MQVYNILETVVKELQPESIDENLCLKFSVHKESVKRVLKYLYK